MRESLETVLDVLHTLDGTERESTLNPAWLTIGTGEAPLTAHTDTLLGLPPLERTGRGAMPAVTSRNRQWSPSSVAEVRSVSVPVDAVLPLDGDLPFELTSGSAIDFDDARGRSRRLVVRARHGTLILAELDRTAYVTSGTRLRFGESADAVTRRVVDVPLVQPTLILKKGDTLLFTPDSFVGQLAVLDEHHHVLAPARIGVTLAEVFRDVQPGKAIWFDDGKMGGSCVRWIRNKPPWRSRGLELAAANWPERRASSFPIPHCGSPPLTEKDGEDLAFIAGHADLVGYSFVRHAEDIYELQRRLAALHAEHVGIVLKIETQHAFNELPKLLLACMRGERFGVMIARGDLAVECGGAPDEEAGDAATA